MNGKISRIQSASVGLRGFARYYKCYLTFRRLRYCRSRVLSRAAVRFSSRFCSCFSVLCGPHFIFFFFFLALYELLIIYKRLQLRFGKVEDPKGLRNKNVGRRRAVISDWFPAINDNDFRPKRLYRLIFESVFTSTFAISIRFLLFLDVLFVKMKNY